MPRLSLEIEVKDKASKEFRSLEKDLEKYGAKLKDVTKNQNESSSSMASLVKNIGLLYASYKTIEVGLDATIGRGFAFNKLMEEQSNGIRALIVATSENVTSTGRVLSITEKYTLAQKEANATLEELQKINAITPHTLGQTAQIYKAMFTSAKAAGASQEDMVEITKLVSIAAGNAGIEFQALLASVDGLANGTFLANSEMGRFLGSIGLTNSKLKEMAKSGDSIEFIKDKLKDFDFAAGSMGEATSNLSNAWDKLVGQITASSFEATKGILQDITDALNYITDFERKGQTLFFKAEDVQTQEPKELIADLNKEIESLRANMLEVTNSEFLTREQKTHILTPLYQEIKANQNLIDKLSGDLDNLVSKSAKTSEIGLGLGFGSQTVNQLKAEREIGAYRRKIQKEEAEDYAKEYQKQIDRFKDPVQYAFAAGIQEALETGDFSGFAENMKSAMLGVISELAAENAMGALTSQLGGVGGIAALGGISLLLGAIGDTNKPKETFAEKMAEELRKSSEALRDTVDILNASGQAGTAISTEVQGKLQQIQDLQDQALAMENALLTASTLVSLSIQSSLDAVNEQISSLTDEMTEDILSFANAVSDSLDTIGALSDALSGTTDYQDELLARAKAQLPYMARTREGFQEYIDSLSASGLEINDLLATIESTTEGTDEYNAALQDLINILDLSDDATLESALNTIEAIELVGDSFLSVADSASMAAESIGNIISSQQAFIDQNMGLLETSGESVARLQERFVQEVNEANLAQIRLQEAMASGDQAAIAEAVANLNAQEQDVLELGQQVIDAGVTAYGSTTAQTDITQAILDEVANRNATLLSVQETLQVEANEISLSILEQLQILNAKITTTEDIFGATV